MADQPSNANGVITNTQPVCEEPFQGKSCYLMNILTQPSKLGHTVSRRDWHTFADQILFHWTLSRPIQHNSRPLAGFTALV